MAGPLCRICTSPLQKEINAALLDGVTSLRDITARFNFPKSTLHNHRIRCMKVPPASSITELVKKRTEKREVLAAPGRIAALEAALPTRDELGDILTETITRLDAIVARNEQDGGTDVVAISGLSNIRQTVSDLAKLAGHVGSGAQTQVNVGVSVSISAADIASALASHLGTVAPLDIIEATADEC